MFGFLPSPPPGKEVEGGTIWRQFSGECHADSARRAGDGGKRTLRTHSGWSGHQPVANSRTYFFNVGSVVTLPVGLTNNPSALNPAGPSISTLPRLFWVT